jgi:hypothetical protein
MRPAISINENPGDGYALAAMAGRFFPFEPVANGDGDVSMHRRRRREWTTGLHEGGNGNAIQLLSDEFEGGHST